MAYLVLARKYRSQTFDQLVGQQAIVDTLLASIAQNRVAHAYLFTGTRGVGKTSSARLFANALNNPGNDAELASAILHGRDTDVIEIDAASNNSVDNARELIANSVYRPLRGRKKVYIIDEVHMLSIQAFNALLKTMEEPPEHVVFILCTTETHKVPATIQSRCQRYDFRNIPAPQVADHLRHVCEAEGFAAQPELLLAVARLGSGSMRDALSLLDRLMAAGDKKLTLAQLERLLGLPDSEVVSNLVDAIAAADPASALERAAELLAKGVGADQLLSALAERLRDLLVLSTCGEHTELVELTPESRPGAVEQARRFDPTGLLYMITLVESVSGRLKTSSFPRALLDAALVRLAMTDKLADATALVTGAPQAPAGASAPAPAATPAAAPAVRAPGLTPKKR
jgi:DNA polymerase-3 subunit gamma/tau